MSLPDTVLKHDGRKVPFEAWRLEASVLRAAYRAEPLFVAESATRMGRQVASDVAQAALAEGKRVIATADIRALATQALRSMKLDLVANAYIDFARASAQLLWRVRVIDPSMSRTAGAGSPWDRRRLMESLRASGVGHDMAGWVAREVERRIVALGQEHVSPALIHSLAMLTLPPDAYGARAYSVRRVSFSAAANLPNWSAQDTEEHPLPPAGAALEQFWLQGVHSAQVIKAVRDNLISLEPYPSTIETDSVGTKTLADPCDLDFAHVLQQLFDGSFKQLAVRAENDAQIAAFSAALNRAANQAGREEQTPRELTLFFKPVAAKFFDPVQRAAPITLNAGGLVAREVLRDLDRTAARLGELAALAAQAHREREEYFLLSPVRGRILPVAVTGLWNAAACVLGDAFDSVRATFESRRIVQQLCDALRSAVSGLRAESGIELALTATGPQAAERRLWRADLEFFLRDGVQLDPAAAYEARLELKLSATADDFNSRLDFAKSLGEAFDEPLALTIEVPRPSDADATQWNDLLDGLAKTGIARLRLDFRGGPRAVPNLARAVRSYLMGYPLFESLDDDGK